MVVGAQVYNPKDPKAKLDCKTNTKCRTLDQSAGKKKCDMPFASKTTLIYQVTLNDVIPMTCDEKLEI